MLESRQHITIETREKTYKLILRGTDMYCLEIKENKINAIKTTNFS
jgi:hypothetical protein